MDHSVSTPSPFPHPTQEAQSVPLSEPSSSSHTGGFGVRLPQQRRSKESWARMLDAGVALICEGGYEAFTIAAICERAEVLPRAIYERVDTKDALFMAVYEHGMERVWADASRPLEEVGEGSGSAVERIHRVVGQLAEVFDLHQDFLRTILVLAPYHPEVYRRGRQYSRLQGKVFMDGLRPLLAQESHDEPEEALQFSFELAYSAVVFRTMYGPGFTSTASSQGKFVDSLALAVQGHLLGVHGE